MRCTSEIESAPNVPPMALNPIISIHTFMIDATVLVFILEVILSNLLVVIDHVLILFDIIAPPDEIVVYLLNQIVSDLHTDLQFLLISHTILKWHKNLAN